MLKIYIVTYGDGRQEGRVIRSEAEDREFLARADAEGWTFTGGDNLAPD